MWLPLPDGGAIPVVMYRNGQKYAIHPDHLGTPRVMTDAGANPVWQWPYSGFGENKPIGILVPTTDPMQATTAQPTLMKANTPTVTLDLRFPGQMADTETGTFYNYYRSYVAGQGRYSQVDPIGLEGGWNRFVYVDGNPLSLTDPMGLMGRPSGGNARGPRPAAGANGSFGAGGSFHTPLGIGLGADAGIAVDTSGNMCFYATVCYTVGAGMAAGGGLVSSVGTGPLVSGETTYSGACWGGGAGLGGTGSVLFGNDGSAQMGRSVFGPSVGGQATYQACTQRLICTRN